MARYYELKPSTFAEDFAAALLDYYGDGVTIESASGDTIVFTCPAVCDKVLKFQKTSTGFKGYWGETSASMTQFANPYSSGSSNYSEHLILSDGFMLVENSQKSSYCNTAIAGQLTNGRYAVIGSVVSDNSSVHNNNRCYFTDSTEAKPICIVSPYANPLKSKGRMCLWSSFVACDGEIELNVDGTFAKIPGLFVTFETSVESMVGSNFYLSKGPVYGAPSSYKRYNTRLYVELEME